MLGCTTPTATRITAMKTAIALLSVLFFGSASASALAAATPEEAQRLTAVLQSYLGAEPGVVSVAPAGAAYAVKLDAGPLIAKIEKPGFAASVTPFEFTLADQGGGKWQVDQDQSIAFSFKVAGAVDLAGKIGGVKGSGIFDEAIGAFASSTADFTDFSFDETMTQQGGTAKLAYAIAGMHYETALSAVGGDADGTGKMTITGLKETISAPAGAGGSTPPMDITVTVASGSQDFTVKGLKARAVLDLIAWAVAHPDPQAMKTAQAELKDKLRATLPVFQNVSTTATLNQVTIGTMLGEAGMDQLDVTVEASGAVDDGRLREAFTVSGLTLPQGVIPPFATDLMPSKFSLDFSVTDFNLAAPAKLLLDNLDLTQEPPLNKEIGRQLLAALMPKGTVTIGLGPSEIIAKIFNLKAEGSMTTGPMAMPAGQATVMLRGLDAIMTALQASPPEMGMQQMAPMVIIAKGMAKTEADGALTWKIESTPQGGVLVNGVDVTKMGGQQ